MSYQGQFSDLGGAPVQGGAWNGDVSGFYPIDHGCQDPWSVHSVPYHSSPAAPPPPPPPHYHQAPPHNLAAGPSDARPAAKRGKPKRIRTAFTSAQLLDLEAVFRKTTYVSRTDRTEISARLGLKDRAIKVWFQNRRMKQKKEAPGGKFSSEAGSPLSPEECSSTTDLHPDITPFQTQHQHEYRPLTQIDYDPTFASLQAQEIFTRAVMGYENAHVKQPSYVQDTSHLSDDRVMYFETPRYDNISPVPQYPARAFSSYSTEQYAQFAKMPDSTTPSIDATSILNGIEMDMASNRDDSGLVSMNSESLDKLGALVSQCITSDIVDISSSDDTSIQMDIEPTYVPVSSEMFLSEGSQQESNENRAQDILLTNPRENDHSNEMAPGVILDNRVKSECELDTIFKFAECSENNISFENSDASSANINVAEIPLPGETKVGSVLSDYNLHYA